MSKINLACAHRHTHTHRHVFGPYLKCQACHLWGYLRWLTSCLWSGWPAPGSHGPNVSLPRHTEHTHTHMHSWWDLIRERKHGNNLQRKQNRCCWLGGGGLTFSYGQCLYCFIGLVQIKTSVLRRETETTGPEWKKLKTYKHLDIPAAQTWQTHWLFITGMNDYFGDGQRAFNGRTSEKHEIAPYGRFPR